MRKKQVRISPYVVVLLSFLIIILLGAFVLCTPIARLDGKWGTFIDAFTTATSATCVTGLCPYPNGIGGELTLLGQITMTIMIQIGGLGFITVLTFVISLFTKMQFKNRYFLSQAVSSDSVAHVGKFVKKVVLISATCEFIGFLVGLPGFLNLVGKVQGMNVGKAIWASLFNAISMYNNAGFDLFGGTSLIRGLGNVYFDSMDLWAYNLVCGVSAALIALGSLSFLVVIEIFSFKKKPSQYSALTKIVLTSTAVLIVGGTALFLLTDGTKQTNTMSFTQALFQSITCRTGGAAVYDQANLSSAGKVVSCMLMLVGGAPVSTAGGIKITTVFIIFLSCASFIRGRKVTAFNRAFSTKTILKAMTLFIVALFILLFSFILVVNIERENVIATDENIAFELFSSLCTVGLSASLTPTLTLASKIIISILMFFGRLGPITLLSIFEKNIDKEETLAYKYVEEEIPIG